MKFLVGQIPGGTAVFLVSGDSAINLTEQDSSLGPDLLGVMTSGKTLDELQDISTEADRCRLPRSNRLCRLHHRA